MTDDEILETVLRREGGFNDVSLDRGGPTNFGITIGTLSAWRKTPVTVDDVRRLTVEEAKAIYQTRYLRPFDGLDAALKPQVVDIAINSGVSQARRLLTIAQQQQDRAVGVQLTIERMLHYAAIVRADPTQAKFLVGWLRRACEFL